MEMYIVFSVPAQIPYLGKIFVPKIWAIFSANQIGAFFNQPYFQKKSMKQPDFLHVDTNSQKLKVDKKNLGVDMVRGGCGQPGHRTLKFTVS